ncbi:collagen-binding domain-containing protein [Aliiglaciecola sp. M165]|uniref:collagen-binding domain-containing protein n=1 Tax=Aliiglaciecola sp. M165 TaxID=2593649 RepID=UPI00163DC52B|nr:collagen-binding domain-containing protein [Aliiglaciecola sp. M165]
MLKAFARFSTTAAFLFISNHTFAFDLPSEPYSTCEALGPAGHYNGFFFQDFSSHGSFTGGRLAVGRHIEMSEYEFGEDLAIQDSDVSLVVGGSLEIEEGRIFNGSVVAKSSISIVERSDSNSVRLKTNLASIISTRFEYIAFNFYPKSWQRSKS